MTKDEKNVRQAPMTVPQDQARHFPSKDYQGGKYSNGLHWIRAWGLAGRMCSMCSRYFEIEDMMYMLDKYDDKFQCEDCIANLGYIW